MSIISPDLEVLLKELQKSLSTFVAFWFQPLLPAKTDDEAARAERTGQSTTLYFLQPGAILGSFAEQS